MVEAEYQAFYGHVDGVAVLGCGPGAGSYADGLVASPFGQGFEEVVEDGFV